MPDSIVGWLGLFVFFGIFGAIALISLGCILHYLPGNREFAQRLMGVGAQTALIIIYGLAIAAAALGIGGMTWTSAGWFLLFAGIWFAVERLLKVGKRRD